MKSTRHGDVNLMRKTGRQERDSHHKSKRRKASPAKVVATVVESSSESEGLREVSDSEEASPAVSDNLARHVDLTKATRDDESKRRYLKQADAAEHRIQDVRELLHEFPVSQRQTSLLENGPGNCAGIGVLAGYALASAMKLPAYIVSHILVFLNLNSHAKTQWDKSRPDFMRIARILLGTGRQFIERVVKPTSAFYSQSGPIPELTSSIYTSDHVKVLYTVVNKDIRFAEDSPARRYADYLRNLPAEGEPIRDLLSYLKGRVCYLDNDIVAKIISACESSPGSIDVNQQTVYRMLKACPDLGLGEVVFGDSATNLKSASTYSEEERRQQKIEFIVQVEANNTYRDFNASDYKPLPNFVVTDSFRLPRQSCRYELLFSDESWVSGDMRNGNIWLKSDGEQPEGDNDKGIRFLLNGFVERNGVHTWFDEEYGTLRDFHVRTMETNTNCGGKQKQLMSSEKIRAALDQDMGPKLESGNLLSQGQKDWAHKKKLEPCRGGFYMSQISSTKNGEIVEDDGLLPCQENVDSNKQLRNAIAYQLWGAKRPMMLVVDNAAYHKKTEGFSPYAMNVTLSECEKFLNEQPEDSELGRLWMNNSTMWANNERKSKRRKYELIAMLKERMPVPLSDIERMAAEIGIRRFGVPHRIVLLPPRLREWNPVEFVWAWAKQYYMSHRKLDANGRVQNIDSIRVIAETLSAVPQEVVRNSYKHVQETIHSFRMSSPSIQDEIRERVDAIFEKAREDNCHRSPTLAL